MINLKQLMFFIYMLIMIHAIMLTIIAETIDTYMIGVGVIFFQLITLHIFVRFLGGLE